MKKHTHFLVILLTISIATSCASTKSAKKNSPAGAWDYSIKDTPEGDFSGVMTITKTDDGYTGQLAASVGTYTFTSTKYFEEENKIVAEFEYSGMPVLLTGMIVGASMTGTVAAGSYEFPLTANKKTP
jgi:hypothetical protein